MSAHQLAALGLGLGLGLVDALVVITADQVLALEAAAVVAIVAARPALHAPAAVRPYVAATQPTALRFAPPMPDDTFSLHCMQNPAHLWARLYAGRRTLSPRGRAQTLASLHTKPSPFGHLSSPPSQQNQKQHQSEDAMFIHQGEYCN